jgi:hypothetical protein
MVEAASAHTVTPRRFGTGGRRVGVLELLSLPASGLVRTAESLGMTKQYASLTPQSISVWCRRDGHAVTYATYYGLGDPVRLMPADLDVLFIATTTMVSPLAYALAKVFRPRGVLCVVGGPHTLAFPDDCRRYFDIVVLDCDETLIRQIVAGDVPPGSTVCSDAPYHDTPLVEERLAEIKRSAFFAGRPYPGSFIPMLTSMGCPYTCDFCVDWNNPYRALPLDRLQQDLEFVSENLPRATLGVLDPNFAVRFDEVLDVFERISPERRNPYIVESSLSILKPGRMQRLTDTRCAAVTPGIESWTAYPRKAGVVSMTGRDKMLAVVEHLRVLQRHVPYVGVNFIFGLDDDAGDEPFEITEEFLHRAPFVWPSVNMPFPFGGTPLFEAVRNDGRLLAPLPFNFYTMPYLSLVPKHYEPLALLDRMIRIYRAVGSSELLRKRNASVDYWVGKASFTLHTFIARWRRRSLEQTRRHLADDAELLARPRGERARLPARSGGRYRQQLGRFAALMSLEESRPLLTRDTVPAASRRAAGQPIPVRHVV